ncbi:hypothetical protein DSC45_01365 [Streptomyces sp. YIM 130001]|uniref:hypothetical protein n=1 Tax=Streptomyces sp. YIM 130001 TaxID=2259644 RepID=UPI000E64CF95|nr:hypothetical protein [Streptomyces sp. YIM 130001]RII21039.1 hypothetical protein DSC45_01365 [Streptomyces sp. YIM 130001]
MLRHEFRPGRLIVGLAFAGAGVAYLGAATGRWETEWFVAIPVVLAGLFFGAIAGVLSYIIRRRRERRIASSENTEAPASTSGSQAIR